MLHASQEADERSRDADRRTPPRRESGRPNRRLLRVGAKAGLVATVVMTAFRLPISRSLPPTDEFWRKYVRRDDSSSATLPAIALHLLYGMGAGVVYALFAPDVDGTSESQAELRGVVTAVVYSLVLSGFGLRVLLQGSLDQDLDPDEALIFHLGHVVYGITLGAWIGSRGSTD